MKILLMNVLHDPVYKFDYMDLGLGYLAACLEKEGHEVKLSLRPQEYPTIEQFIKYTISEQFDVYGVKVTSTSIKTAKKTLKAIRSAHSDAVIIAGGPHVSCDRNNVYNILPEIDFAFYSEAEIGMVKLLNALADKRLSDERLSIIPNLIWKKDAEIAVNPAEIVQDLDTLPFPAWELMDPRSFSNASYSGYSKRFPIAPMVLSRGCPYKCTYCGAGSINGRKIRTRSTDNIMQEIDYLINKFGIREIQFFDSNCAHKKASLREVCREIIKNKIDLSWNTPVGIRLDSIDEELADLMKRSGCFQASVGIESASPRILEMVKKNYQPDIVEEKIRLLRNAGIEVLGSFMIGFPTETVEEMNETIKLALKLPLTAACFSILTPFPGTEIYYSIFKNTSMNVDTLNSLDFIHYQNNLSEVSYRELRKIQKIAYLKFHLRIRTIRYLIGNLNSLAKFKLVLQRAYIDLVS